MALLRSYLQRSETARRRKTGKTGGDNASPTALQRVHTIANTTDLPEEQLERILMCGIFTEEFGSAIAGDSKFQVTVDDVLRVIRGDPAGSQVMRRAIAQLRAQPR